jgi:hypothetical protein
LLILKSIYLVTNDLLHQAAIPVTKAALCNGGVEIEKNIYIGGICCFLWYN